MHLDKFSNIYFQSLRFFIFKKEHVRTLNTKELKISHIFYC